MHTVKPLLLVCLGLFLLNTTAVHAVESHAGHGGGGGDGDTRKGCSKPKISRFKPGHLKQVSPGSEFTFWVSGVHNPANIKVTVKKVPIEVTTEDKKSFYLVKGRLPAELSNTAARVQVHARSITGNTSVKCNSDNGWLLKISEPSNQ